MALVFRVFARNDWNFLDDPVIIFGGLDRGLVMTILRRTHADSTDHWDGNWLSIIADVAIGKFHGRADGDVRAEEFVAFRDQVRRLSDSLAGRAEFATMENGLASNLKVMEEDASR